MSWGTELWDQYDIISTHTHKGIDFLERYGRFVHERCTIEMEYAGKLRRLAKNYQPKRKEEDEPQYTSSTAFRKLLLELGDLAGQREVVAENLQQNVLKELTSLVKELKDERKKHLSEGSRLSLALQSQVGALERARRAYERGAREAERALDAFQRADADLHLSRAEVEKQRMNMTIKSGQCEEAKNEYTDQLQKTNAMQRLHYQHAAPEVFKQLQDLDEKRIKNIKYFMTSSVEIERNVYPIIIKCLDGMDGAASCINEKEDTALVVERYKSGFLPPGDFPLEEPGRGGEGGGGPVSRSDSVLHHTAARGTLGAAKAKKRVGLFGIFTSNKNNISADGKEDYSDLPPNQRRKKLDAKVQELKKQVIQEQGAMDGLMKMKGVYEGNSALGDPMTVEGQLNECSHKLDKLRQQLSKYEGWLEEARSAAPQTITNTHRVNGAPHRHSIGSASESLSRSASDSSVSTTTTNQPHRQNNHNHNHSYNNHNHSNSTNNHGDSTNNLHDSVDKNESGAGGSGGSPDSATRACTGDSDTGEGADAGDGGDYYYEPELQPLGTCKALYPFEHDEAHSGYDESFNYEYDEMLLPSPEDNGENETQGDNYECSTTGDNKNMGTEGVKEDILTEGGKDENVMKGDNNYYVTKGDKAQNIIRRMGEGFDHKIAYVDLETLPIYKMLYDFEATSAGSMGMSCGEVLYVVEADQGDGWTRVRRQHDHEEGFVPTSYIASA